MIKEKTLNILRKRQIEFVGSGRNKNHYEVAGKYQVTIDLDTAEMTCDCRDCSVKTIPNKMPPRCAYTEAVLIWFNLKLKSDDLKSTAWKKNKGKGKGDTHLS